MDGVRLGVDGERLHPLQEAIEVALHARADGGIEHRGREPLEFAEFGSTSLDTVIYASGISRSTTVRARRSCSGLR